jgi:hypothetical protein
LRGGRGGANTARVSLRGVGEPRREYGKGWGREEYDTARVRLAWGGEERSTTNREGECSLRGVGEPWREYGKGWEREDHNTARKSAACVLYMPMVHLEDV